MSQILSVSSHEEAESDSGESDRTTSSQSHSRCNSSNSILTTAVQTEQNWEASTSFETTWTDSKHSSYLDFMEANFVKNMFGSSYCAEDLCGKTSSQHHQYVDIDEEYDDDSAQSQLHIPYETMEFKMCDRGDWTWRPASRALSPAGMPWVLLSNPWVKHFRPKNASMSIPSTPSSSKKGDVRSMASFSPKLVVGSVEHLQRVNTHEVTSGSNPLDAGVSNSKKRALWSTDKQMPATRHKMNKEVKSGGIRTINQEDAVHPKVK